MSPPVKTWNEESAPWKSSKGEKSESKGSPERYRSRDSGTIRERHKTHSERTHYGNRVWRRGSPYERQSSYDHSRHNGDRKSHSSESERRHHRDDRRSKSPSSATSRESNAFTSRRPWKEYPSSRRPSRPPNRSRWDEAPRTNSSAYEKPSGNFNLIFQHINETCSQDNLPSSERPMAFIHKLIADEAMRMLSQAASLQETTYLNVPFVPTDPMPTASAGSDVTESSNKPETENSTTDDKQSSLRDAAAVNAADSALLQKSAEQVTKRLITRLTTMSKYDLKQMIDNPAGKYETALNRHAQNKLRAEVRKQLKSIGLNELGSSCVAGDGTVESDEAIDANKIPPSLLAQIGQALDLDFEDLTQTDTESIEQGSEENCNSQSTSKSPQPMEGNGTISFKPITSNGSDIVRDVANLENTPDKPLTKTRIAHKPTTPARKRKIVEPNGNTMEGVNVTASPVTSTPQRKVKTPKSKKTINAKGANKESVVRPVFTLNVNNADEIASKLFKTYEHSSTTTDFSKFLKANDTITDFTKDIDVHSANDTIPATVEPSRVEKNVPFLRISTVEELNRRLDDHETTTSSKDKEGTTELNGAESISSSICVTHGTDDSNRFPSEPHSGQTMSNDNIQPRLNNYQRSAESEASADTPQQGTTPQGQSDSPIFQRLIERRKKQRSAIAIDFLSKRGETRITENGEVIIARSNDKNLKYNHICIPQKDRNRQRSAPIDTATNDSQPAAETQDPSTTEAQPNTTNQSKTRLPVVPDTHQSPQLKKKRHRWIQPTPVINSSVRPNNESVVTVSRTWERIPSLSSLSSEEQILNEAYDQYTTTKSTSTVDGDEPRQDPVTATTLQEVSPSQVDFPSIRIRSSSSISQELSTPETSFTENVSKEETETRPQELRLVETAQLLAHQSPVTSQETVFDEPEMIVDSKESVERIPSPEPNLDSTTSTNEEYILGGDAEKKCEPMEPETSDRDSNQPQELEKEPVQEPAQDPPSGTPQPTCSHAARLQSLYAVTEQLQSIDAQTMDLYNRKTQIDAIIMQLNAERMDINQQLVKLHNTRGEQMNYVRITLLELGMSEGSDGVPPVFTNQIPLPSSIGPMNQVAILHPSDPGASVSVVTAPQQERTIRRITPIGNSVLMKIFQRRRAPSERSVEENPPVDFA